MDQVLSAQLEIFLRGDQEGVSLEPLVILDWESSAFPLLCLFYRFSFFFLFYLLLMFAGRLFFAVRRVVVGGLDRGENKSRI